MAETHDENVLDPQNPLFCIMDKKNLYIQNVGHIRAYIHANFQDFWRKKIKDPMRPNMSKNVVKNTKNNIFLNPFLGHFQKSEVGSESMSSSVMTSSFQKMVLKSVIALKMTE